MAKKLSLLVLVGLFLAAGTSPAQDRAHRLAKRALKVKPETCEEVQSWQDCHRNHRAGCSNAAHPNYDAYLNYLKNQLAPSSLEPEKILTETDIAKLEGDLPDTLGKGNHAEHADEMAELDEGNIQAVIGYFYYIQRGARETVNCMLADPANTEPKNIDFHIGIGFDSTLAEKVRQHKPVNTHTLKQKSIIVETTPHYRAKYHPKWTMVRFRQIAGRQVKVVGQLLADNEHLLATQDCGREEADAKKCWRLPAWQLHPVTRFYVCRTATPCAADSTDWQAVDDLP